MTANITYPSGSLRHLAANKSGEPAWAERIRQRGLELHEVMALPTPKHEDWKYTPLREISEKSWHVSDPVIGFSGSTGFDFDPAARITLLNGRLDSNPDIEGLEIVDLGDLDDVPDWVGEHLGAYSSGDAHTFASLNSASFVGGVAIRVQKGAKIGGVVELLHVGSGAGSVSFPRILIVAEEDSQANFCEHYISSDAGCFTVPVTEVTVAQGADIEHVRVQRESQEAYHIGLWAARQDTTSEYRAYNIAFGGKLARVDHDIWIGGEDCITRLDGVVVATGDQLIDNHTRLDHAVPNCNSFEIYKQIVDDNATVVFNGKIFVHQDAQKTDAKQTNQALLLSPNATINSKPQLEIFADDVKCTHGATVGSIEDVPLFYMMTRGIPREQAQQLLVYAFAAEVMELVADEKLKAALIENLYTNLQLT